MTKTEIKHAAQDRILGAISNEMLLMAESLGFKTNPEDQQVFREVQAQGIRIAKLFGVTSYSGIIHEGKPVTWNALTEENS